MRRKQINFWKGWLGKVFGRFWIQVASEKIGWISTDVEEAEKNTFHQISERRKYRTNLKEGHNPDAWMVKHFLISEILRSGDIGTN